MLNRFAILYAAAVIAESLQSQKPIYLEKTLLDRDST